MSKLQFFQLFSALLCVITAAFAIITANAWVNEQTKQHAPMCEYVESIEAAYQRHNMRYNFLNQENQGPYIPYETLANLNEHLADNLKRSLEYARSRYIMQQNAIE